ncbi:MAG: hypothetical protein NXI18_16895 [Alphaproteobacteria bacterium]|nr:hypothetical protein [Alphaproteobacteria bacterium]
MPRLATALALGAALLLSACFQDSKAEIAKKAENVSTVDDLRAALGEPDELNKAGPIEEWIYDASDGSVRFPILAGKVGPMVTGDKREK